jgi:hypothetical protein
MGRCCRHEEGGDEDASGDGEVRGLEVVMAVAMVMPARLQGVAAMEQDWDGPGPRFVQITAGHHNCCGGCDGEAPVGTRITYDRLERHPYHQGCAWVAIEQPPSLIPAFAGDAPAPGQVFARPSYGWLVCMRVEGRTWADNGVSAISDSPPTSPLHVAV